MLEITILGSGTSQGVPVIACNCDVCKSENPKDKRLRSSVLIKYKNKHLIIDTGPDFRQQMLREKITQLDAVIFTHSHVDHIIGLDDVRAFNHITGKNMEIYAEKNVLNDLQRVFQYIFAKKKYPGVPNLNLNPISNNEFFIHDISVTPIRGMHLKLPVLGYRITNFAYITDVNFISEQEQEKLKNLDTLVICALRKRKHISHFTLSQALKVIKNVKPRQAFLTHISHRLGLHNKINTELPENVKLAYDGLKITIT